MKSPSSACPLDTEAAAKTLERMLVGAYIDQISTYSLQASLRFMSDQIRHGAVTAVDVIFACDAGIVGRDSPVTCTAEDDFFSNRARFLADVYRLIGKNVGVVKLQPDGTMIIGIESSSIIIHLTDDDYGEDDWIWKVESEANVDTPRVGIRCIVCFSTGDRVSFVSKT